MTDGKTGQASVSRVVTDAERSRSFGAIAADYDRLRPSPAPEAVHWLLPERRDVVVDVGAGTGLFSRGLASQGAHVIAVEPDERMRAILQARSPGIEVIAGSGEAIPMPDGSADGLFASSAWHWMDSARAIPEVARVLRDGGRFGLAWTGRDPDSDWLRPDLWFREPLEAMDRYAAEMRARGSSEQRGLPTADGGLFANIETETFRYSRSMTPADLVEWLTTYSRVLTAPARQRERGRARAAAAIAQRFPDAELIDVPLRTRCWRSDRVRR